MSVTCGIDAMGTIRLLDDEGKTIEILEPSEALALAHQLADAFVQSK